MKSQINPKFQSPRTQTNAKIWCSVLGIYLVPSTRDGVWFLVFCLLLLNPLNSTSQTKWYKYPGNPVFEYGKSGEWDQAKIAHTVLYENGQYNMWYKGWSNDPGGFIGMGYASSPDGINWQKHKANPVEFEFETDDWAWVFYSFDIIKKDSMYLMWYTGFDKKDSTKNVGFAWSENGLNWTKHTEPVLKPGKDDEWDGAGINTATVFFDWIRYHMWYSAYNYADQPVQRIGYATSDDGVFWKKHPANPVLDVGGPGTWDDQWIGTHSVNFNGSCYEMWYDGWNKINTQVGYATSVDGFNWIKFSDNPVLQVGELGHWDTWIARIPTVVSHDSIYKMWYYGHDVSRGNIGYATMSVDEAKAWDTATINKPQTIFKVQVFNMAEYINVDSLIEIMPELSGIELIDACNKLALAYSLNDSKKSLEFAEKALELSDKENFPEGRAMALYSIGNSQYVIDNYSDALASHLSALWLFDSLDMQFELGNLLSQIAGIHSYSGSHDLSCRYYKQALDAFERLNDTVFIMHSLIYLGYSYLFYGDTASAIKPFRRGLSLAKTIQDKWKQVVSYEAIGLCYSGRNLDTALYYFNEANKIYNTLNDHRYQGYNFLITAEAYVAAGPEYYDDAENCFFKCFPRLAAGRQNKVRLYLGAAELYFITGRYDRSKEFLDISLEECQILLDRQDHKMFASLNQKLEVESDLKLYMEKIYRLYYRLDTALHDKDLAFTHFMLATQWNDSIYNDQNRKKTAMMQGTYETESTQNIMGMLQKENEVKDLKIQQSRTFLFGLGGFVIVIIVMAWLFIRQNKARAEHKSVVLEQKLLRLQMNPHFIFNSLADLQSYIWSKDPVTANDYLASFSKLLRLILENSRQEFVPVEKEIAAITHYLKLQSLRYKDKFEYLIDIDDDIDEEHMMIPPMLAQPYIENSIEHGILAKETPGHIEVKFSLERDLIHIEVTDDGIGFKRSSELKQGKSPEHESLAMKITQERLLMIYKKYRKKIRFSVSDILDEKNNIAGARVSFAVPYSRL